VCVLPTWYQTWILCWSSLYPLHASLWPIIREHVGRMKDHEWMVRDGECMITVIWIENTGNAFWIRYHPVIVVAMVNKMRCRTKGICNKRQRPCGRMLHQPLHLLHSFKPLLVQWSNPAIWSKYLSMFGMFTKGFWQLNRHHCMPFFEEL